MTQLPRHLFISDCDGALHDTRTKDWASTPLRATYRRTYATIETTAQLLATIRAGSCVWPGGYPLYFVTSDGESLSFDAVTAELASVVDSIRTGGHDGWRVVGTSINYEDGELLCGHSGVRIHSAYAG